jgi:putative phosphoribosyl transferase
MQFFKVFLLLFPQALANQLPMEFPSREMAGQQLGRWLHDKGIEADIVLGLPRGGVVVAAEVARSLQCPLDVLVVRKI